MRPARSSSTKTIMQRIVPIGFWRWGHSVTLLSLSPCLEPALLFCGRWWVVASTITLTIGNQKGWQSDAALLGFLAALLHSLLGFHARIVVVSNTLQFERTEHELS